MTEPQQGELALMCQEASFRIFSFPDPNRNPAEHPQGTRRIKTRRKRYAACDELAEMEGFEPPRTLRRLPDFESGPFSHLGTSPYRSSYNGYYAIVFPVLQEQTAYAAYKIQGGAKNAGI